MTLSRKLEQKQTREQQKLAAVIEQMRKDTRDVQAHAYALARACDSVYSALTDENQEALHHATRKFYRSTLELDKRTAAWLAVYAVKKLSRWGRFVRWLGRWLLAREQA